MAEDIRFSNTLRGPLGSDGIGKNSRAFRERLTDLRRTRGLLSKAFRQARKQGDYLTAINIMGEAEKRGLRLTGPQSYESLRENALRGLENDQRTVPILERQAQMFQEGAEAPPARPENAIKIFAEGEPHPREEIEEERETSFEGFSQAPDIESFGVDPVEDMSTTERLQRRRELFERMRRSVTMGDFGADRADEFGARARQLGVSNQGFGNALSRLRQIGRRSLFEQARQSAQQGNDDPYTTFRSQASGLGVSRNAFNNAMTRVRRSTAFR